VIVRHEYALRWSDVGLFGIARLGDEIHDREQGISESVIFVPKGMDGSSQRRPLRRYGQGFSKD
jgi:hypothetical protein